MALLLPAALSRSHHANNSRNLRTRYRDSYKHNRDHEYCVEFEVIKASKACHKLPPYNLMLEGDRITVRCDLEALVQDAATTAAGGKQGSRGAATTTTTTTRKTPMAQPYSMDDGDDAERLDSSSSSNNEDDNEDDEEETTEEDDAQNMLEPEADAEPEPESEPELGSNESHEYKHQRQSHRPRSATSKRSAAPILPPALQQQQQKEQEEQQQLLLLSYHCRGEGLSGRTTRWSALPAPSCRGKWLRLTIGPPKKCNHAQFIFV
ncbi:uncharacterized protein LOC135428606 [Drosophila montana]|uniref:uncharacterized protein LOC135428606 n=1 Tax=Drosophila montana TaxID=40370 RepID=UPI00313BD09F